MTTITIGITEVDVVRWADDRHAIISVEDNVVLE